MKFCFSGTFSEPGELVTLAKAGDDCGWDTFTLSDHIINPVETRAPYPYTKDGEHFDVPALEMLPAPTEPVPVMVGGVSDVALRRAARNDGWVSDLHTVEELREIRAKLDGYRKEYGRDHLPFSVFGSARDAWDMDGYRRLADAGVTHLITMPWYFYAGAEADLAGKVDGIKRFADDVIAKW